MYRLMMIAMLFVMSSTIFAMPFGTVIDFGGSKMIVVSQEGEEVRLKPFVEKKIKVTPNLGLPKAEVPQQSGAKPEWESKTVLTEGVKNVQECLDPTGCPQNAKTGECLEGCSEQKVHVKVEERIISDSEFNRTPVSTQTSHLTAFRNWNSPLMFIDDYQGTMKRRHSKAYGTPVYLCYLSVLHYGSDEFQVALARVIMSDPSLLHLCEKRFPTKSTWSRYYAGK